MPPPRSPARGLRRGFLLYALLGLLLVVGSLAGSLHMLARHRNLLAHRASSSRVAEQLAAGSLSHLQGLGRRVLTWPGLDGDLAAPLTGGSLFGFLLQPLPALREDLGAEDREERLGRWFGPRWRYPLDELERSQPGSEIEVDYRIEAEPLYSGSYRDDFEKRVRWTWEARARYRGTEHVARRSYEIKVLHPFPPLVSKFTLFAAEVPGGSREFNQFRNDDLGNPSGERHQSPFVLWNTPLSDPSDRDLIRANRPHVEDPDGNPWALQGELRSHLWSRGWVFLGTGPGNPETVTLNLTAGPALFDESGSPVPGEPGEFFHLYDPVAEESEPSFFYLLPEHVPEPFRTPLVAPDGSARQAFVNLLFWGFHADGQETLERAGLGTTLETNLSSLLHLYGNDDVPSRTRVFGPVEQAFVRISYLAVDRDPSDADEASQEAAAASLGLAGVIRITPRETAEPIFAFVPDAAGWDQDLERLAAGEDPLLLEPIPTEGSGLPAPRNRNFGVDTDGDGRLDAFLDPGHPTVPLHPDRFHYAGLFPAGYGDPGDSEGLGYANFMSKVERRPYNQMIDYMLYSGVVPPERHAAFPGWSAGDLESMWRAEDVQIDFGDPLHLHYQSPPAFRGELGRFLTGGDFEAVVRARVTATVPDAAAFERAYPPAPNAFQPEDPTPWIQVDDVVLVEQGPLELAGLRFQGSGAVVLAEGDLILGEVLPSQQSLPSFVALDGDLVLEGPGRRVGLLAAPRGTIRNPEGLPRALTGSLAVARLRASALEAGGSLQYDATGDFTRYRGGQESSYADHYWAALSAAPTDWGQAP